MKSSETWGDDVVKRVTRSRLRFAPPISQEARGTTQAKTISGGSVGIKKNPHPSSQQEAARLTDKQETSIGARDRRSIILPMTKLQGFVREELMCIEDRKCHLLFVVRVFQQLAALAWRSSHTDTRPTYHAGQAKKDEHLATVS